MPAFIDLTGEKFGRLTVVSIEKRDRTESTWLCQCDCGAKKVIRGKSLRDGKTVSCGCYHREEVTLRNTTHGQNRSPEHNTWCRILQRCYNTKRPDFPYYGGRGITVCDRWKESFEAFFEDMGERPKGLTIDRIDNDGPYSPENCRWASRKVQANNSRKIFNCRKVTLNNETKTLRQWAELAGIKPMTIYMRLERGWSDYEAVFGKQNH